MGQITTSHDLRAIKSGTPDNETSIELFLITSRHLHVAWVLLISWWLWMDQYIWQVIYFWIRRVHSHYGDVIMGAITSQITSLTIVYSTVYSDADQRKHQSSASLAFVWGIHRWPVNSPHKGPVTRKMFPFDDVIVLYLHHTHSWQQQSLTFAPIIEAITWKNKSFSWKERSI